MNRFSPRPETSADYDAIFAINAAAFPTDAEARLVDALRARATPVISLVAEITGAPESRKAKKTAGHILFSPVTLSTAPTLRLAGLAPMAVAPDWQRKGIGSALVRAGLDACRAIGFAGVVVLGHTEYYPRFGFTPSAQFGFRCEYEVPAEAFMALELQPGVFTETKARATNGESGVVRYHAAFANL